MSIERFKSYFITIIILNNCVDDNLQLYIYIKVKITNFSFSNIIK